MSSSDTTGAESLALHAKHRGKIAVQPKVPLDNRHDYSLAYSPGVAAVALACAANPAETNRLTVRGNSVAVISDGSAVLGLGNIGPAGAFPVMEGKAALFKALAGIDAWPLVLASQDVAQTIATVRNLAPSFAGINLEDFKAPECFAIEEALQDLGIPVMHDDQHGTAIVVLAGLTNALTVVNKEKESVRIIVNGAGAAGIAVTKLLLADGYACGNIILCDTKGAIYAGRADLGDSKKAELAQITNATCMSGDLSSVLVNADVFIGLSKPNLLHRTDIATMAKDAIVFALANPVPEIFPAEAHAGGARIIATGRSDLPNQVNNSLAFPGVFRGAIDCGATRITTEMKLAAAHELARIVTEPTAESILPFATEKRVVPAVAAAVASAWNARTPD